MTLQNDTEAAAKPKQDAIEVVQHVPRPVAEIWDRLTQRDGIEAFLGEGATLGGKGDSWHASDGTYGVTRSYHPGEQVRVSWHADADAPPTLVDLRIKSEDEGTLLTLRHQHLPPEANREALVARWGDALARLTQM